MNMGNGFYDVPDDKLATIVTSLEMFAPPQLAAPADNPGWALRRIEIPDVDWYRDIYRRIGLEWLWFSRIIMPDDELIAIIHDPQVEIRVLEVEGRAEGLLELDYRITGECELAFLGVSDGMLGNGAGKWLMHYAIDLAWKSDIKRLWIHTCTLDHPRALPFYIKSGFAPYKRQLEIADDPRINGHSPRNVAGHYPLFG